MSEQPKQIEDARATSLDELLRIGRIIAEESEGGSYWIPDEYSHDHGFKAGYAAARSDGWIPVEDRLPDEDGNYLVWAKIGNEPVIRWLNASPDFADYNRKYYTHWQKIVGPQATGENDAE